MKKQDLESLIDFVNSTIEALQLEQETPSRLDELNEAIETRDELLAELWSTV